MRACITHHHGCDCREQKVAVLIKAALDASFKLEHMFTLPEDEEVACQLASRLDSAVEALGPIPTTLERISA
jgi:hypothetical protein